MKEGMGQTSQMLPDLRRKSQPGTDSKLSMKAKQVLKKRFEDIQKINILQNSTMKFGSLARASRDTMPYGENAKSSSRAFGP